MHGPEPSSDQEATVARAAHRLVGLTLLSTSGEESGALIRTGDLTTATARAEAQVEFTRRGAAADPGDARSRRDLSFSYGRLGEVLRAQGDLDGAEQAIAWHQQIEQRLAGDDE